MGIRTIVALAPVPLILSGCSLGGQAASVPGHGASVLVRATFRTGTAPAIGTQVSQSMIDLPGVVYTNLPASGVLTVGVASRTDVKHIEDVLRAMPDVASVSDAPSS